MVKIKNNFLLQIAPHLPLDGKLKDILKATPGACLTYAVIEGIQVFTDSYPHPQNINIVTPSHWVNCI